MPGPGEAARVLTAPPGHRSRLAGNADRCNRWRDKASMGLGRNAGMKKCTALCFCWGFGFVLPRFCKVRAIRLRGRDGAADRSPPLRGRCPAGQRGVWPAAMRLGWAFAQALPNAGSGWWNVRTARCMRSPPPSVGYADISPSRGEIARQRRGGLTELPAGGSGGLTAIAGMAEEGGLPSGGRRWAHRRWAVRQWFWGRGVRWAGQRRGSISPLEGEMPGRAEGGMAPARRLGVGIWPGTSECTGRLLRDGGEACLGRVCAEPTPLCRLRRHLPLKGGDRPRASWRPHAGAGAAAAASRWVAGWRVGGLVVLRPTERISARRPRPWIRRPKGGRCRRRPALRESRRD